MKDCVYPPLFSFHGSHTSIELVAMGMKFDVGHQSISSPSTKFAWHLSLSLSLSLYIHTYIYIYNVCVCVCVCYTRVLMDRASTMSALLARSVWKQLDPLWYMAPGLKIQR
jgi:hypothetical protein